MAKDLINILKQNEFYSKLKEGINVGDEINNYKVTQQDISAWKEQYKKYFAFKNIYDRIQIHSVNEGKNDIDNVIKQIYPLNSRLKELENKLQQIKITNYGF